MRQNTHKENTKSSPLSPWFHRSLLSKAFVAWRAAITKRLERETTHASGERRLLRHEGFDKRLTQPCSLFKTNKHNVDRQLRQDTKKENTKSSSFQCSTCSSEGTPFYGNKTTEDNSLKALQLNLHTRELVQFEMALHNKLIILGLVFLTFFGMSSCIGEF